ncbi:MAG: hypothetical protein R3D53_09840 [Paracoccaceae bacterium]
MDFRPTYKKQFGQFNDGTIHIPRALGGFDLWPAQGAPGRVEIIYDDGVARRMVWRVCGAVNESQLGDALARAVRNARDSRALRRAEETLDRGQAVLHG